MAGAGLPAPLGSTSSYFLLLVGNDPTQVSTVGV